MPEESKALGHDDESGFQFAKEMLAGDVTAAVNFCLCGERHWI